MFERFTDRARRVVVRAQEEAGALGHNSLGTEHLLLALVHEGGLGAKTLESLSISPETIRQRVSAVVDRTDLPSAGHIPFTPRAKKVLELAMEEARGLGHTYIGSEHILLGLLREADGVAAQVLTSLGADLDGTRGRVVQLIAEHHRQTG